jgi:hypothetical protein
LSRRRCQPNLSRGVNSAPSSRYPRLSHKTDVLLRRRNPNATTHYHEVHVARSARHRWLRFGWKAPAFGTFSSSPSVSCKFNCDPFANELTIVLLLLLLLLPPPPSSSSLLRSVTTMHTHFHHLTLRRLLLLAPNPNCRSRSRMDNTRDLTAWIPL